MDNIADSQVLLSKVSSIIEKYKKIDEVTGNNFNIFRVCEIHDKEVLICRFIYQLLNPNGLHNQNSIFLKKFNEIVLENFIPENELKNVVVTKEHVIKDNRRIDLLIETEKHIIPIEVKIYAGDQEEQCKDYLDFAIKNQKEYKLFYLTLDGHYPSEYSIDYKRKLEDYENDDDIYLELKENKIECISFEKNIIDWIEACIKEISLLNLHQITDNVNQFLNNIKELCNMGNDNVNNDVYELMKNEKNFQSFIAMKQCESKVTSEVLKKLIKDLNVWAIEKQYKIVDDYKNYEKEVEDFCAGNCRVGKEPGFGIVCENNNFNFPLEICIELSTSDTFFYGICITNEKDRTKENIDKIRNGIGNIGYKEGTFWAYWDYIKINNNEIHFKNPNEAFAELLDDEKYNNLLDNIKSKFEDLKIKITD